MTIEVAVIFTHGGYASVAAIPCDIFGAVGTLWNACLDEQQVPRFRVRTASVDGEPAMAYGGLKQMPMGSIKQLRKLDLVFIPDAGFSVDEMVRQHRDLLPWLRRRHAAGTHIAAVCSGVGLVAAAGLLDGKRATTHWALRDDYVQRFPNVQWDMDTLVTSDQGMYCGGGVYACADLSLHVVEQLCGRELALNTARALLLDMPRTNQWGFAALPVAAMHYDEQVKRIESSMQRGFRGEIRIEALAEAAGMSSRTLERRFKAATGVLPKEYMQRLRVGEARRLLEEGGRSVEVVAETVG